MFAYREVPWPIHQTPSNLPSFPCLLPTLRSILMSYWLESFVLKHGASRIFPGLHMEFIFNINVFQASQVAQWYRICLLMQETWVRSLDQEDPQEKEMATHSSILAWEMPWTEEPGGLQSVGLQRVGHDWSNWAGTHPFSLGGCPF